MTNLTKPESPVHVFEESPTWELDWDCNLFSILLSLNSNIQIFPHSDQKVQQKEEVMVSSWE